MWSYFFAWSLISGSMVLSQTSCPSLPSSINYSANLKLPSPYLSINGSKITSKSQWECRKDEIRRAPMPPQR